MLPFLLSQLASYSPIVWLAFVAIAFGAGRFLGWGSVIFGHFLVAGLVTFLDVQWIQEEMRRPGWDGLPDMDFVFYIGLLIRIVLINTVLLPLSIIAVRMRVKQPTTNSSTPS